MKNRYILRSMRKSFCMLLVCCACSLYADGYSDGVRLFKNNKPLEAIPLFQNALVSDNPAPELYNYLGLAYYQTGQLQKAFETFQIGLLMNGTDKRILYYNAGNVAFALSLFDRAEDFFTYALNADSEYAEAMLNRANTRMKTQQYEEAVEDYIAYLTLDPGTVQRENIEKIIALLQQQVASQTTDQQSIMQQQAAVIAAQEQMSQERTQMQQAIQSAEAAQAAAEQVAAEEQKKTAENERRQKLLKAAAAALQPASAVNSSAGSEGVIEYESDEELD